MEIAKKKLVAHVVHMEKGIVEPTHLSRVVPIVSSGEEVMRGIVKTSTIFVS